MGSPEGSRIRVVGADGGGTRLRLALADGEGQILARGEAGPALLDAPPTAGAPAAADLSATVELIRGEVAALAEEAGAALPLDALCAGLAGAGRAGAARRLEGRLLDARLARRVRVVTDAEAALLDAFPEGPGILVVAGTGSIALARDAGGQIHRVGGWGALLGDEGSGYALGLEGLRAAIRGEEGRGPATRLTAVLFEAIGADGPEAALAWSRSATKAEIAALAPRVAGLGGAGGGRAGRIGGGRDSPAEGGGAAAPGGTDAVARELTAKAVRALVAHAEALAVRVRDGGDLDRPSVGGRGFGGGGRGPGGGPAGPPHPRLRVALAGGLVDPGRPRDRGPTSSSGDRTHPGEAPPPAGPLRHLVATALDAAGFEVVSGLVDGARGAVRCALDLARPRNHPVRKSSR